MEVVLVEVAVPKNPAAIWKALTEASDRHELTVVEPPFVEGTGEPEARAPTLGWPYDGLGNVAVTPHSLPNAALAPWPWKTSGL